MCTPDARYLYAETFRRAASLPGAFGARGQEPVEPTETPARAELLTLFTHFSFRPRTPYKPTPRPARWQHEYRVSHGDRHTHCYSYLLRVDEFCFFPSSHYSRVEHYHVLNKFLRFGKIFEKNSFSFYHFCTFLTIYYIRSITYRKSLKNNSIRLKSFFFLKKNRVLLPVRRIKKQHLTIFIVSGDHV